MEPSTSAHFLIELEDFLSLPITVKRRIISYLSPWDLLNLAEFHECLHSLVVGQPKRASEIGDTIEGWNGSRRTYYRHYYSGRKVSRCKDEILKHKTLYNDMVFLEEATWEEVEELMKRHKEILLRNCALDSISTTMEMLDWGIRATCVRPYGETAEEIIAQIESTKATEVDLYSCHHLMDAPESMMSELFRSRTVQNLATINVELNAEWLHHMEDVSASSVSVTVKGDRDYIGYVESFLKSSIKEWTLGVREINVFHIRAPMAPRSLPSEIIEDLNAPHNFEIEQMAGRLSSGFDGAFADANIDPSWRLIKRKDGKGLLIWSGIKSILLVSCDYESRRKRGLGVASRRNDLIWHVTRAMRKLKEAENSEEKEDVIDGMGGENRSSKNREKAEETLMEAIGCLEEYSNTAPFRELNIDMLYDDRERKVNLDTLIDQITTRQSGWPETPGGLPYPNHVLQYIADYRRTGQLPRVSDLHSPAI